MTEIYEQPVNAFVANFLGTFGHVGDGNLHPTLVIPRGDLAAQGRAMRAAEAIAAAALSLGGTLTGEHGIGTLKRHQLAGEIGPDGLRASWAIKNALDPLGIMNPGKVLPLGRPSPTDQKLGGVMADTISAGSSPAARALCGRPES